MVAQGQHEGAHLTGYSQFIRTFHVHRQSAAGRAAGEGKQRRGHNGLEESYGAEAAYEFHQAAVYEQCMDDAGQINGDDNFQQGQQHGRTVGGNYGSYQTEHADGSEFHDVAHHLVGNFGETVDGALQIFCSLAHAGDGDAQEESEDDDLQHVGFQHGIKRIGGEDIHDDLHDGGSGFGSGLNVRAGHVHAYAGLKNETEGQTQNDGEESGAQVPAYGLGADAADLLDVAQGAHADDQRGEHQRHDEHFDHVHEDGAQRPYPSGGEFSAFGAEAQAGDDAQAQSDKDLNG